MPVAEHLEASSNSNTPSRCQPEVNADQDYYVHKLRMAVRRVCPNSMAHRAEDIAQKAVLRLLERIHRLGENEQGYNSSFLYRMAYYATVDEMRLQEREQKRKSTPVLNHLQANALLQSVDFDPERVAHHKNLLEVIDRCLDDLREDRKTALRMSLMGHSNHEISQIMGWNARKTQNLLYRGRKDLQLRLKQIGLRP